MINLSRYRQRPLRQRAALMGVFALGAVAMVWKLWSPATSAMPQTQWLRVEPQVLENRLGLTGRIQAAATLTLSAPFEGMIKDVLVNEGQRVEASQPLLTLDTGLLDIQLRQALADLLKAQRTVQDMQHWEQGQEVARARRTLNNARISLANTEANLKDTRTLFERGIVARMEVDALAQQAQAQRLDLSAAQDELQAALDRGRGENRQIAEMELANAQSRHQTLMAMQAQQVVRAPFAGVLVRPAAPETDKRQPLQPGMRVSQGMPLFGLVNPDHLQVVASLDEADLHQLHEGMAVDISGDGFAGLTLYGHIQTIGIEGRVADVAGAGARYDVLVTVATPSAEQRQRLRLGMSARLSVVTYRNEHGIAVPAEALHTDEAGNSYILFRQDADSAPQRRTVVPGVAVPQGVEVKGLPDEGPGFVEITNNSGAAE
ncbi:efflux RND transporter periplasmic adaptor subunit [Dickeya solani]|uniref:HlyD family efflux transporter periplasmic adaptor subunit n=1 Tax=Dickeya solani TaxID=1089444 RepID=A0ABU4EAH1_9GAMM|nr:HlyD family efflux transporter periplasmic adaptor subunit [Dickeya solani]MCA6997631.1 HlyD family efflux transporter periplasmic adaptor subunit [Dickeya solani]MCZ0821265.1 HlyD family efflux transporter periplasmic adaptor subunit [Dickeya solani]MDV6997526.1 HlyD family efflux transporter periplasmic adaptor subunit [Dickeya solani]MDV7003631.1 HlyD family efflux transporter periplasmic adaptor subunit [Dickeya solani]MDV7036140.1 HlyD family efflux transporter periplasmic adaptor subu